jgi:hypothetical protein
MNQVKKNKGKKGRVTFLPFFILPESGADDRIALFL